MAHPNILILCADHFRADTLSCLGHPVVRTPNLDALAARGTRFDRAYCMAPMCIPTRISMFTGLSPHTLNKIEHVRTPVDPRVQGLSQFMTKAGYQTGIIGKTHFWPPTETYRSDYVSLTIDRHLTEELGREDAYLEYLRALGLDGASEGDLPAEHYRTYWTARDPQANVRDTLFGEMHKGYATPDGPWWSGQKMAMRGKWKYIYYSRAWEGSGTEEELSPTLPRNTRRCAASCVTRSWNGW